MVSLRQAAISDNGAGNNATVVLGLAPLAGSLCIVASECRSKTAIAMSRAGWTVIGGPLAVGGVDTLQFMWRIAVAGDPASIFVSYNDLPDVSLVAAEFLGSWPANPVDVAGSAIGTGTPFLTHKALTPTINKSALFVTAGLLVNGGIGSAPWLSAQAGLTDAVAPFMHRPVNGHPNMGFGYRVIPNTNGGPYDPTWSNTTGNAWGAYAAVFAETPAVPTGFPRRHW